MDKKYSQSKALGAITKASFIASLKSPQSFIFSLIFPLVFVFIFGAFSGNSLTRFAIALAPTCDTSNLLYKTIAAQPFIAIKSFSDTVEMRKELEKGKLTGILNISKATNTDIFNRLPHFFINIKSTSASSLEMMQLIPLLENLTDKLEKSITGNKSAMFTITKDIYNVREYKQIDFVLPGQIGFSLLFSTLFGIAFTFFNLREQLVLKRFYATPVNRLNILLGIGFSRIFFQLINVIVLITVGHLFINFTLAHGFITFIEMVSISILFLLLLMGVGLIFSSISKNDNIIPLLINIFSLPQMLLSGTFFSISVFPEWLQTCCKILPLTHFNMAMRKISFEGVGILECWQDIGVLCAWIVLVYAIVWKVFKWE